MHKNYFPYLLFFIFATTFFLSSCATNTIKISDGEKIESEIYQLQESGLLDVGILLFEKGEITEKQQEDEGAHEDIRKAEARYIAYHLKETMQLSNGWGAIRVLPTESQIADVIVRGAIVSSNGEELILQIRVVDSTGQPWFKKTYKAFADEKSYHYVRLGRDVYQFVYNRIANDIYRHRRGLAEKKLVTIRNTSELRYAAGISPDPFLNYIASDLAGRNTITRLPANNDPMLGRVRKVREREFLFIDAINEYYSNFYDEMRDPYENWRKYYLIEAERRRKVENRANQTKFAATVVMVAGLFRGGYGLFTSGALLYKDGIDISKEAEIHNEAIRELSDSLQVEVSPMVVEIQGRTVELTGSIEEQYQKWRELLREIYTNETGFVYENSGVGSVRL
jgi:hypothetical protein